MSRTVVLIHGAWLTPRAWDRFRQRYEARGLTVLVPAWPCLDGPVEVLQRKAPAGLGRLGIDKIVERYAAVVRALPEPPILIGHAFGGLFVQLLLDHGLGACGVAIGPIPPRGVLGLPLAIRTSWPVLSAGSRWNRAVKLSFEGFATRFAQTLPAAQKPVAYAQHVVPAPGRIFLQAALGLGNRVDFGNRKRPPLLLMAGDADRMAPASRVRANAHRQQRAASRTDLQIFEGRSHWLCNEPGWEDVADFALDWALANALSNSANPE